MPTRRPDADTPSALTSGMESGLRFCLANPGREHQRHYPLRSGLYIALDVDFDGSRHVLLSRRGDQPPSAREAQTIIEHWPEPVAEQVDWTRKDMGAFKCLVAAWPAPPEQLALETRKVAR